MVGSPSLSPGLTPVGAPFLLCQIPSYTGVVSRVKGPRDKMANRAFMDPDARTVTCECGKRLGVLWPIVGHRFSGGTARPDGPWVGADVTYGTKNEQREGFPTMKNLAHEDWLSVRCRRCKRDWQGRESYVVALISGVEPGKRVTLGAQPLPRRERASRAW